MPRVSVLIPAYNSAAFLGQALDSVFAQTYRDFEVIVVDDGSEDDTAAVAAARPEVRYIRKEHSGISATRNLAIAQARGEVIAFLDADDLWTPDKLEKQVAYLDACPDCQVVFSLVKNFFDGPEAAMTERQRQLLNAKVEYCLPACCVRKEVFETCGIFREDLAYGEDTYWITRLWTAGIHMKHCIQEPLYLRRIHNDNISLTHRKVGRENVMALMADAIRQQRKESKEHD
ncbi:MAG: glycosyltransferase family 2 protein [Ruminococcaceae bacterium]|nr:glycosyltransferase family 2 protein [Oscillospiraceae bacterium]